METTKQVSAVAPFFAVDDVDAFATFVQGTFGAKRSKEMKSEDGILRHATLELGDVTLMISLGVELYGARPGTLQLSVDDVDGVFERALKRGAEALERPAD